MMMLIAVVSILSLLFTIVVGPSPQDCKLSTGNDISSDPVPWLIKIYGYKQVMGHGSLVTHNRVLSAFTPFQEVATDGSKLSIYKLVAYMTESENKCHQKKEANKFIPPPGWPKEQPVRELAFWEVSKGFETDGTGFLFTHALDDPLFETSGRERIKQAIETTKDGDRSCHIHMFSDRFSKIDDGSNEVGRVTFKTLRSCEERFCEDGLCDLKGRFDFCVFYSRIKVKEPAWQYGTVLFCQKQPIGLIGLIGVGPKSKARILAVNILSALGTPKKIQASGATTAAAAAAAAARMTEMSVKGTATRHRQTSFPSHTTKHQVQTSTTTTMLRHLSTPGLPAFTTNVVINGSNSIISEVLAPMILIAIVQIIPSH